MAEEPRNKKRRQKYGELLDLKAMLWEKPKRMVRWIKSERRKEVMKKPAREKIFGIFHTRPRLTEKNPLLLEIYIPGNRIYFK